MDRAILFRIKHLNDAIQNKVDRICYLRSQIEASAIRYKPDIIQSSGNQDMLENAVAQIIDLENEINEMVEDLVACKTIATRNIDRIYKEGCREVLYERYVLCLKIKEIAESQGRSEIWVKKTHKEGLELFDSLT